MNLSPNPHTTTSARPKRGILTVTSIRETPSRNAHLNGAIVQEEHSMNILGYAFLLLLAIIILYSGIAYGGKLMWDLEQEEKEKEEP